MIRPSRLLPFALTLCLAPSAFADIPPATSPAAHTQIQQSVDRAITYLQTESATWMSQRKCAACHHAAMPLWALASAGRRGFAINQKYLADTFEATLGSKEKMIASGLLPDPARPPDTRPMASGVNMGLPFMAVAAKAYSSLTEGQQKSVRLIVEEIVSKQREHTWQFYLSRPPINESQQTDVAWLLMALQGKRGADLDAERREAQAEGMAWLTKAEPENRQAQVLKLLVSIRAGYDRQRMQPAIDELFTLQNPDGGWSQLPKSKSDAFATGQLLYVLALAGYTADRPEIKKAIDFLLTTQKPDGSWPMTSRATPDGSPGSAKLLTPITTAATSWVVLALAEFEPRQE